jgi:hypothetical protein
MWSWPILRYYPGICLEDLRKAMKNLSQDSQHPGQNSNWVPDGYKSGVLPSEPACSITTWRVHLKWDGWSVMMSLRIDSGFCNNHDIFLGPKTTGIDCNCRILTEEAV